MSSPSEIEDFHAAPGVLIAVPQLEDPNFRRSVVLMLEHNAEGALGLIINAELAPTCTEVTESLGLPWPGAPQAHLRRGGPVDASALWMLHGGDLRFRDTRAVVPGVAVSQSREALHQLCEHGELDLHLLVGYSGWGPGQLEQEMATGSWILGQATAELVFRCALDEMWTHALNALGIDPAHLVEPHGLVQ